MNKTIEIYSDGAVSGNPGVGGYGAVIKERGNPRTIEKISRGVWQTTNNRMELMGVLAAIAVILKRRIDKDTDQIIIYSDSKYVVNCLGEYVHKWVKFGFKKSDGKPVSNIDLMQEYGHLYNHLKCKIKFEWVKGHNGNPYNEMADKLAVAGKKLSDKTKDSWYEESTKNVLPF